MDKQTTSDSLKYLFNHLFLSGDTPLKCYRSPKILVLMAIPSLFAVNFSIHTAFIVTFRHLLFISPFNINVKFMIMTVTKAEQSLEEEDFPHADTTPTTSA